MLKVRAETLRRAAEIVGSEEALALLLGAKRLHLALWLRELEEMPDMVFLRAVDIVLEGDMRHGHDEGGPASPDNASKPGM